MSQRGVDADDAAVIEDSRQDPERFGAIFDRHAPHIHRYLARRLGPEVADDLVGETFLAAFRQRHRYDPDQRSARPWLYGIATNLIGQHRRDEVRRWRASRRLDAVLGAGLGAGSGAGPGAGPGAGLGARFAEPGHADRVAETVTAQAARSTLSAALAAIPAGERDVLLLIAWEELTYGEVGMALRIPVGTVRSRLNRARRRLREALGRAGLSAREE